MESNLLQKILKVWYLINYSKVWGCGIWVIKRKCLRKCGISVNFQILGGMRVIRSSPRSTIEKKIKHDIVLGA